MTQIGLLEMLERRELFAGYSIAALDAPGFAGFEPTSINASGVIAGNLVTFQGQRHAAFYNGSTYTNLNASAQGSVAAEINDAGQIAGTLLMPDQTRRAFRYSGGVVATLGLLNGANQGEGISINNSGEVVGDNHIVNPSQDHAVRYPGGSNTPQDLGVLPGTNFNYPYAINDSGVIAGFTEDTRLIGTEDTVVSQGFVISGGQMQPLAGLGGMNTKALAINENGDIAGWSDSNDGPRAFLYSGGQYTQIPVFGVHGKFSTATDINNSQQIVGYADNFHDQGFRAGWVYANGVIRQVDSLVPTSGWSIDYVTGINDRGQIIGIGAFAGASRGFIMTPTAFNGTAGDDNFFFRANPTTGNVDIWQNAANPGQGTPTRTEPLGAYPTFMVNGLGGDDAITVDFSNGNPFVGEAVYFDGGAGSNSVRVIGTSANDTVTATANGLRFNSTAANIIFPTATMNFSALGGVTFVGGSGGVDSINVSSGVHTINADTATGTPNVSMTIGAGATVNLPAVQRLNALTISAGGVLNVAGHDLLLNRAATPAASVRQLLTNGRNNGAWNGTGGIVSTTAAADATRLLALGYADGADGGVAGLAADKVLVRLTYAGDANLDRAVNQADFNALFANFGQSNRQWRHVDVNYDGKTDFSDFQIMEKAFGKTLPAPTGLVVEAAKTGSPRRVVVTPATSVFSKKPVKRSAVWDA